MLSLSECGPWICDFQNEEQRKKVSPISRCPFDARPTGGLHIRWTEAPIQLSFSLFFLYLHAQLCVFLFFFFFLLSFFFVFLGGLGRGGECKGSARSDLLARQVCVGTFRIWVGLEFQKNQPERLGQEQQVSLIIQSKSGPNPTQTQTLLVPRVHSN